MNREQMGLASASTSSAVPAARHRGPVAALIAAIIVAVALMFAMPSLAFASTEAGGSQQATDTQEILLSQQGSSKSVNKTPDEPKTPPAYTQQDAYKSTPQSTDSGVDSVSGAGDSNATSYTPGDDKSSISDKDSDSDSDVASDPSISGTKDTDDSTLNEGDGTSDSNKGNDSTADSNGASSGSTDEIATDNNQSAHPTGSDSKADNVIATPGDKESADQNDSTTSVKTEEVNPQAKNTGYSNTTMPVDDSTSTFDASDDITTQAAYDGITIYFDQILTNYASRYDGQGDNPSAPIFTQNPNGTKKDPIFLSDGTFLTRADEPVTIAGGAALSTSTQVKTDYLANAVKLSEFNISASKKIKKYGSTLSQWKAIGYSTSQGIWMGFNISGTQLTTASSQFNRQYKNADFSQWKLFPVWADNRCSIEFQNTAENGNTKISTQENVSYADTINWVVCPDSTYPAPEQYVYYSKVKDPDKTTPIPEEGIKLCDYLNGIYQIYTSTEKYNSDVFPLSFTVQATEVQSTLSFKVTYKANGGTGEDVVITYTSKSAYATSSGATTGDYDLPEADFTRAGYQFKGWHKSNTASTAAIESAGQLKNAITNNDGESIIEDQGNYTLYAIWEPVTYSITYEPNANGETVNGMPSNTTTRHGAFTPSTTTPTRTGYDFLGWSINSGATVADTRFSITADTPLYAIWKELTDYTVNFNSNGGTSVSSLTNKKWTDPISISANPTKTGHTFAGWTISSEGGTAIALPKKIQEIWTAASQADSNKTITLVANWTALSGYSVVFNSDGGTSVATQGNKAWTDPISKPTDPTKTGYTFAGWTYGTSETAVTLPKTVGDLWTALSVPTTTKSITLKAKWNQKGGYTVVFVDNYNKTNLGTISTRGSLSWEAPVVAPADPESRGYTFNDWRLAKVSNNGNGDASKTVFTNNCTFGTLWNAAHALNPSLTDTNTTITLYAKWSDLGKFTITYDVPTDATYSGTAGEIYSGENYTIHPLTTAANPTRPGWDFVNWKVTAHANGTTGATYAAGATISNIKGNITLTAQWNPKTGYAVNFDSAGGSSVTALTNKTWTDTISKPTNPTRAGYDFNGWYTEPQTDGGAPAGTVIFTSATTASVAISSLWNTFGSNDTVMSQTLYARWTPATGYSVAFDTDGGTTVSTQGGKKWTDPISKPSDPTKAGYAFRGWTYGSAATDVTLPSNVNNLWAALGVASSTKSITVKAKWEENIIKITFHGNDDANVKHGSAAAARDLELWVGAATGKLYTSNNPNAVTSNTISTVSPVIADANAHSFSKWTYNSATGPTVPAYVAATGGTTTAGVLTAMKSNGLYIARDYYLSVEPKSINYVVEYFTQNTDGTYSTSPFHTENGTRPYGWTVQLGTTAGDNTATTTRTFVLPTSTDFVNKTNGFRHNPSAPGTVASIQISSTAANNIMKIYFDRMSYTLKVNYYDKDDPEAIHPVDLPQYAPEVQDVLYGAGVDLGAAPTKPGYIFEGWFCKNDPNVTISANNQFNMPADNLEIVGTWSKDTFKVQFKVVNEVHGTIGMPNMFDLDYGESLDSIPTVTANPGYYFIGWKRYEGAIKRTETVLDYSGISPVDTTNDHILNDPWTVSSHTVFVAEFGKTYTVSYFAGTNGAFPSPVVDYPNEVGAIIRNLPNGSDLPVLAEDAANAGKIFNGATARFPNTPKGKSGWKFAGWRDQDGKLIAGTYVRQAGRYVFQPSGTETMPATVTKDLTFTAEWVKATQQIIFSTDGVVNNATQAGSPVQKNGTPVSSINIQIGDTLSLPASTATGATADAYRFVGWATTRGATTPAFTSLSLTDDNFASLIKKDAAYDSTLTDGGYGVTLYPVFEEQTVTITYELATGTPSSTGLSKRTETIKRVSGAADLSGSTPTIPTGYKFEGWYTTAAHATEVDGAWVDATTKKITPQPGADGMFASASYFLYVTPIDYTITFKVGAHGTWNPGGDTADKTVTIPYGSKITTANVPGYTPATGYTFKHWAGAGNRTYSDTTLANYTVEGNATFEIIWDELSNFNIHYNPNGGTPDPIDNQPAKWTDDLQTKLNASTQASGVKKQGYTFDGWYYTSDFQAGTKVAAGVTYQSAVEDPNAGITNPTILNLYAKWIERTFTVKFITNDPSHTVADFERYDVLWTDDNLFDPHATLSTPGHTFLKWSNVNSKTGQQFTNDNTLADIYRVQFGQNDNTPTNNTITLYGIWDKQQFSVQFKDTDGNVLKTENGLEWTSSINYYDPSPSDGSKTLLGWTYTPAGNTMANTWNTPTTALPLTSFQGTVAPDPAQPLVLTAVWRDNVLYTIHYMKANLNAGGTPNTAAATQVGVPDTGYVAPGTTINIESFNGKNYITYFENHGNVDLNGYKLTFIPGASLYQNTVTTDPSTHDFYAYWVEQIYTIKYDLGEGTGHTNIVPADKQASWTSTGILPDQNPSWEGHKPPVWQYLKDGNMVTIDASNPPSVSAIALSADPATPITLYAMWPTDSVTITFAVQVGGEASNGAGVTATFNNPISQTIDAINGTPHTMTASAADGYRFAGWWNGSVKLSDDPAFQPSQVNGMYVPATYTAHFETLGNIDYVIRHFFENVDNDGFTENNNVSAPTSGSAREGSRVEVTNAMKANVAGFTYLPGTSGITGIKEVIEQLSNTDKELRLYYKRNVFTVVVTVEPTLGDNPTPCPQPDWTSSATLYQASTNHKVGTELTLPRVDVPAGWDFKWTVNYIESGAAPFDQKMNMGDTFTMPNAPAGVEVLGTWTRLDHKVNFISEGPNGTVTVKGGISLPINVKHGKTLNNEPANGTARTNIEAKGVGKYTLQYWEYTDENNAVQHTADPDSVIINHDTTFIAKWIATYSVTYHPGAHAAAPFTGAVTVNDQIEPGSNVNVNAFPLVIGENAYGFDSAPAAEGYKFAGWSWTQDGVNYFYNPDPTVGLDTTGLGTRVNTIDFPVTGNVNFTALWAPAEQNLSFKIYDLPATSWTPSGVPGLAGTTGDTYQVTPMPRTGEEVRLLGETDVQREGYILRGWSVWTDANGNGEVESFEFDETDYISPLGRFTMPAHAVTFVPVWTFESLSINYQIAPGCNDRGTISNTTETITDAHADGRGSIAKPALGYRFDGWYTTPDCSGAPVLAGLENLGDEGWKLAPVAPIEGWSRAVYFYAKFVADVAPYTIEFYFQNDRGGHDKKIEQAFYDINTGELANVRDESNFAYINRNALESAAENQHLFKGYEFNEAADNVFAENVKGDGTTRLKLYYKLKWYDIAYDLGFNGEHIGEWANPLNPGAPQAIGGKAVNIPAAELEGMRLTGWKIDWTDEDGTDQSDTLGVAGGFTMPYANVKATALWSKLLDITINFVDADGNPLDPDNASVAVSTDLIAGETYTVPNDMIVSHRKPGYQFSGNYTTHEMVDGTNTVDVIYNILSDYKIIFNANGGFETTTIGGMDLSSVVANFQPVDLPTKRGYTLGSMPNRWNTAADGTGTWLDETMTYSQLAEVLLGAGYDDVALMARPLTLYAIWHENDFYKVIYDLNNDQDTNSTVQKPVADSRNPQTPAPIENVKWTQSGFDIRDEAEFDAAPIGYEFAGWNTKRDGSGLTIKNATQYLDMSNYIDPNNEQPSITLYAMWKELMIEIKYTTNGEGGTINRVLDRVSAVTGQHVASGSSAGDRLHSVATAKPGWHFVRWEVVNDGLLREAGVDSNVWYTRLNGNMANAGEGPEFVVAEPDADGRLFGATYRAIFAKNPVVAIEYDVNAEDVEGEIKPTQASHGLTVSLHKGTGVHRDHYKLVSWNTEPDGSGTEYKLGQSLVMPENGMKLFAQWKPNSYSIHVVDRDDDVAKVTGGETTVDYDNPVDPEFFEGITQTPKPGSTFQGWKYTMTDAETGEVFEGVIWNWDDLPEIVGPIEIEALYETEPAAEPIEDPVEPEMGGTVLPKTGDSGLAIFIVALLVAIAAILFMVLLVVRRRNEDDDPEMKKEHVRENTNGALFLSVDVFGKRAQLRSFTIEGANTASVRKHGAMAAQLKVTIVAAVALLAFVGALFFAPGVALATGDPGTGASHQTQYSNTDPATHSTGSFQSNASKSTSAAKSTASSASKSSTKSAVSGKSASRATSKTSAASSEGTSNSNSSASASKSKIDRITAQNSLRHRTSVYRYANSTDCRKATVARTSQASSSAVSATTSKKATGTITAASASAKSASSASTSMAVSSAAVVAQETALQDEATGEAGTGDITPVGGLLPSPDDVIKVDYVACKGGIVSRSKDYFDAQTGVKYDADGNVCSGNTSAAVAIPRIGYHFAGWSLNKPLAIRPDEPLDSAVVSTDAVLDDDTVRSLAHSEKEGCYKPVSLVSNFDNNKYLLVYDTNVENSDSDAAKLEPTSATFGASDKLTEEKPTREGYRFLCWNTDASGKGVPLAVGETLTTNKMRAMVVESPIEDADGAAITLYAQWLPEKTEPVLIGTPEEPKDPSQQGTSGTSGQNTPSNSTNGTTAPVQDPARYPSDASAQPSLAGNNGSNTGGNTVRAVFAGSSLAEADDAGKVLDAMLNNLETAGSALASRPALEVVPASVGQFALLSTDALEDVFGLHGVEASNNAYRAAEAVLGSVGALVVVVGAAGALSRIVARKRVMRTQASESNE